MSIIFKNRAATRLEGRPRASFLAEHLGWFARRTARVSGAGWTRLRARQVFILPTRIGLAFTILLLVLLLGAINYDNNLIFAFTFLLVGLGLVAMLHTYRNLVHLEFRSGPGRPGFVGGRIEFRLWLRAADGRARQIIEMQNADGSRAVTDAEPAASAIRLERNAVRRGRLALGKLTVATQFPLGLFRAWSDLDVVQTEPVYPAPAPPGEPPQAVAVDERGARAGAWAGADDFRGLRRYRPGDSLRQIDWKALAREQGLLTKQFGGALPPEDWLDFASAHDTDPEARLSRLCRWVLDAEQAQRRYGLRLPGMTIAAGQGEAHRDRCLLALADFGTAP